MKRAPQFFRTYERDWTPKFFAPVRQYSGQMAVNLRDLALAGAIVGAPAVEDEPNLYEGWTGEQLFALGMLGGRMA